MDLGKTNKEFFLFNKELQPVYEISEQFKQTPDEDGHPCDELEPINKWMRHQVKEAIHHPDFEVEQLNFSTHGASFVHIGKSGEAITPLYDYLKPMPEALWHRFYQQYGPQAQLALETASPPLVMLNSGLQIFWLKYKTIAKNRFAVKYLTIFFYPSTI